MLQEIVTRAVVGRAERTLSWRHKLAASGMSQVMGVRIARTTVGVELREGQPHADVALECDLWCGDGEGTKVLRTSSRFEQGIPVTYRGEPIGEHSCRIQLIGGPRTTGVRVEGDSIFVDFEATVAVEVSAFTRLWVEAYDMDHAPGAADWDVSGDSVSHFGSH